MKHFLRIRMVVLAITLLVTSHAFCKINITLSNTQVLVNAIPVDSSTSVSRVKQITGADLGRFESWGDLGFWYIYDGAGVGFHWSPDSTRLLTIYTEHHGVHSPVYRPTGDFNGILSYLGTPITPFNNLWTVLHRAAGHVISIAPDLYSVYLSHGTYDAEITWFPDECMPPHVRDGEPFHMLTKQKLESCVIYLGRQDYSFGRPPLHAKGAKNMLYLNDLPAPDSLYSESGFISEARPCVDDILSVTQMGKLEADFQVYDDDSATMLKNLFKDSLLRNEFKISSSKGNYDNYYDEKSINRDGYGLIADGYFTGGAALMDLGQELYPDSYNAHDSYAEALLSDRRPQAAMRAWQSALDLNPVAEFDDHSVWYHTNRLMRLIKGKAIIFTAKKAR